MPDTPEERLEIEDLLPFYLNGSLNEAERQRVEAALEDDATLQTELDFLVRWRRNVKHSAQDQGVGALGERRLLRSIRGEERVEAPPEVEVAPATITRFLRPALALAAGLALIAQTATIWNLQAERDGLAMLGAGAEFKVQFDPAAREGDLRAFLLERGLVIVEGPSALGFYELDTVDDQVADAELEALLEALKAAPELFDYAERPTRQEDR